MTESVRESIDKGKSSLVTHWLKEIELVRKSPGYSKWLKRAQKVVERYTDADKTVSGKRFNILWSNVQTMQPALYARTPKPEIERRYKDQDVVGRATSQVLERSTTYAIQDGRFDRTMRMCRDDYLLSGRAQAWVRYVPTFGEAVPRIALQVSNESPETGKFTLEKDGSEYQGDPDSIKQDEQGFYADGEPSEILKHEEVVVDYIHWKDFLHSEARNWQEVRWCARRVFMTRQELIDRFGEEIGKKVSLTHEPDSVKSDESLSNSQKEDFKKAVVWEIWDKPSRKVCWISEGYTEGVLDALPDPLKLTNFFPCPRPLLATTTNDSLIPIPDYIFYQDQAKELDALTNRINHITKALKVAGVRNGQEIGLSKLLKEGGDGDLIPVKDWQGFNQRGGLQGAIQFLPFREVSEVLMNLYQIRDREKADVYETTGMSDIIRGNSNPQETATAQQIKGQFATLRLSDRQAEVQRFARDLIAIIAEVIAEHFQSETIAAIAGVELMDEEVQNQWPAIMEMLRSDLMRNFRIDIETDSTIALDEQLDKQNRAEFLQNVGGLLQNFMQFAQMAPQTVPLMGEMILFGARGFKAGRHLESSIEQFIQSYIEMIQQQQQAAQQPQGPSPEEIEAQQKQQNTFFEQQLEQIKLQMQQEKQGAEQALKAQDTRFNQELESFKVQQELALKAQKLEADTQLKAEQIRSKQAEAALAVLQGGHRHAASQQPIIINMPGGERKTTVVKTLPDGTKVAETIETDLPDSPGPIG